jgi:putative alpha-1,2-mannosidase
MAPSTFHSTGISFDNGYQSEGLAHILGFVMQHQDAFGLPPNLGRQGLLQIPTPTAEESTAAAAAVNHAFDCLGSVPVEPALA